MGKNRLHASKGSKDNVKKKVTARALAPNDLLDVLSSRQPANTLLHRANDYAVKDDFAERLLSWL